MDFDNIMQSNLSVNNTTAAFVSKWEFVLAVGLIPVLNGNIFKWYEICITMKSMAICHFE